MISFLVLVVRRVVLANVIDLTFDIDGAEQEGQIDFFVRSIRHWLLGSNIMGALCSFANVVGFGAFL